MTHTSAPTPNRVLRTLAACAGLFFVLFSYAADLPKQNFDLPSGDAESTLKMFTKQSGEQILYPPTTVAGITTKAVKGEMTSADALDLMLAQTILVAFRDHKTRAFTIKKAATIEEAEKNDVRAVARSERPSNFDQVQKRGTKSRVLELEQYEVTGTRIRTLAGEQPTQPTLVITSEDIYRFGVGSLADVLQRIPQVSSYSTGQVVQLPSFFGPAPINSRSTRVTATLRGSPSDGTLLLVNGRRAPKNGQASSASGYDLSGIPLAAIERVEVLLDGASAIYGADATGGVINVILKKQFRGTTIRLNYENTFDTDAGAKSAAITAGFAVGKVSGLVTAAWEDTNSLAWRDRTFLSTLDRRSFGGSFAVDFRGGVGGAGRVQSQSGNLPGLTTNIAAVPMGSSGGNTILDFQNAGTAPVFDAAQYAEYSSAYERRSVVTNLEFEHAPLFRPFFEGYWGRSQTRSQGLPVSAGNILIPAGAPGNPFGVPVLYTGRFYDVAPSRVAEVTNQNTTVGARGDLPNAWRYEVSVGRTASRPSLHTGIGTGLSAARVAAAYGASPGSGPNLLYDSRVHSPNAAGTIESLVGPPTLDSERNDVWTYDVKADGPVFETAAGLVRVAIGAEYREEYVDFPLVPAASNVARNRYTSGYYAEARIPIAGKERRSVGLRRLEATVALRHDSYSDFSAATNPRYGLLLEPFPGITLRGSYSEGHKVPTLSDLYSPLVLSQVAFAEGAALDAQRGNTPVVGIIDQYIVGNPKLSPERSESFTAGLVWDVRWLTGLSVAVNYYETSYLDRVGGLSLTDRIVLFPNTVERGANLPGDAPGWAGPVVAFTNQVQNIASHELAGFDVGLRYHHPLALGTINATGDASWTTRNIIRTVPYRPPTVTSTTDALPLQVTSTLFWSHRNFTAGVIWGYRARNRTNYLDSTSFTPSAQRWDAQLGYEFDRTARRMALRDLKITLTVFNVLDATPPMAFTGLPDNGLVDSRLRRYAVNVTKSF